jgi:hypothetical protein
MTPIPFQGPFLDVPSETELFNLTLQATSRSAGLFYGYIDDTMLTKVETKAALDEIHTLLSPQKKVEVLEQRILPALPTERPWTLNDHGTMALVVNEYLEEEHLSEKISRLEALIVRGLLKDIFVNFEVNVRTSCDLWNLSLINETDFDKALIHKEILLSLQTLISASSLGKRKLTNQRLYARLVPWGKILYALITLINVRLYQIIQLLKANKKEEALTKIGMLRVERSNLEYFVVVSSDDNNLTHFFSDFHG